HAAGPDCVAVCGLSSRRQVRSPFQTDRAPPTQTLRHPGLRSLLSRLRPHLVSISSVNFKNEVAQPDTSRFNYRTLERGVRIFYEHSYSHPPRFVFCYSNRRQEIWMTNTAPTQ